jgi:hypothetical protein
MYKAVASGAKKEQNEETKAADATKKITDKDKALKQTHENDRLWITTKVHHNFPIFFFNYHQN